MAYGRVNQSSYVLMVAIIFDNDAGKPSLATEKIPKENCQTPTPQSADGRWRWESAIFGPLAPNDLVIGRSMMIYITAFSGTLYVVRGRVDISLRHFKKKNFVVPPIPCKDQV